MNTLNTIKLSVFELSDDGFAEGGIDFYWTQGAHIVLIQRWEHRAAGNHYSQIEPDPMSGDNLLDYFLETWQDKEGVHYHVQDVDIYR